MPASVGSGMPASLGSRMHASVGSGMPASVGSGMPASLGSGMPASVGSGMPARGCNVADPINCYCIYITTVFRAVSCIINACTHTSDFQLFRGGFTYTILHWHCSYTFHKVPFLKGSQLQNQGMLIDIGSYKHADAHRRSLAL